MDVDPKILNEDIESQLGAGSVFRIVLPLIAASAVRPGAAEQLLDSEAALS